MVAVAASAGGAAPAAASAGAEPKEEKVEEKEESDDVSFTWFCHVMFILPETPCYLLAIPVPCFILHSAL